MVCRRAVLVLLTAALVACAARPKQTEFVIVDNGKPIADAQFAIHAEEEMGHDHHECKTYTSDAQGRIQLNPMPAGKYVVAVFHPIYVLYEKFVTLKGTPGERVECTLTQGGYLDGTIVDLKGAPVAQATVKAIDPSTLMEFRTAETDASGKFSMTGLPIGTARLYVHSGRHRPANEQVTFRRPAERQTVTISVRDGKSISGRVVDIKGNPIPGVTIGCTDEGAQFFHTGPDGAYIIGGLGDEPVNMYGYKVGLAPHHLKAVKPGTTDIILVLRPPAIVRGELRIAAGEAQVSLVKGNLRVATALVRPNQSKFEFTDLCADRYILVAEGASALRMEVAIAEGETRDLGLLRPANLFQDGEKR